MAQIYILFGVLKINEHKDTDAGVRYFAKALDISPAVKIPPTMATKAVKAAFAKAEDVDPATIGNLSEADRRQPQEAFEEGGRPRPPAEQEKQESRRRRPPRPGRREEAGRAGSTSASRGRAQADRGRPQAVRRREQALADELAQTKVSEAQLKTTGTS